MSKKKQDKTKETKIFSKRKKIGKYILFSVAGILLLCLISFGTYSAAFAHKNYANQRIGSLNLGGKTKDETKTILGDSTNQFLKNPIALKFVQKDGESKDYSIASSDINLQFDVDATSDLIWRDGRDKNIFLSFWQQLKSVFVTKQYQLIYSLDADSLNKKIIAIAKETDNPEKDYSISYSAGKFVLNTDTKDGSRINQSEISRNIETQIGEANFSGINFSAQNYNPTVTLANAQKCLADANKIISGGNLTLAYESTEQKLDQNTIGSMVQSEPDGEDLKLIINDDILSAFVGSIAQSVDVVGKNATLGVVNSAVVITTPETEGMALDQVQAKKDIENALLARISSSNNIDTVNLKVVASEPQVTQSSIATLGLKDLIGTGTTDFSGSPANRVANIKNGVSLINGLLVQPGSEFSTVGALSPIDQAHGYVQGLVIVNNQTLPADGGGLCQVSTTLFRSILNAGLPITARTPHSYEVSYYQRGVGPGLDATIYDPKPDFKWINDTGHVIYIQGVIKGMNLTFNLFGTSDGRTAVITGPTLLSTTQPSGDPIYVNTDTLPVGTTHMIDPPVPGGKTTATYTVTRGGQVINTQTFNSNYQAMPAQYLVGTAPVAAPTPAPTPTPDPTAPVPVN